MTEFMYRASLVTFYTVSALAMAAFWIGLGWCLWCVVRAALTRKTP